MRNVSIFYLPAKPKFSCLEAIPNLAIELVNKKAVTKDRQLN